MNGLDIDVTDQGILYLLQQNARRNTTAEIGERLNVSSSTVGSRISHLESDGIITSFHPEIDYETVGLEHHLLAVGTAPSEERSGLAEYVLDVEGVVNVREFLGGERNLSIELVGESRGRVESILSEIDERGVAVEEIRLFKRERHRPFDNFGKEIADD